MNYILYKDRNTAAYNNRSPFIYRKKRDVLVLDIVSVLRSTHSKEILFKVQTETLSIIQTQHKLALCLITILAKESERGLPIDSINLYSLVYDKIENTILNEKIRVMISKPKSSFSDLDSFLFNILFVNDFELSDLDDPNVDYMDYLFDTLYQYLEKLSWFEYRMNHFFYLLLSEKEEVISDYHLEFIVFFLQSYYNVFSYYSHLTSFRPFSTFDYGFLPLVYKTDKAFSGMFNFISRYELVNDTCSFIEMVRLLDYPRPRNNPLTVKRYHLQMSNINGSGTSKPGGTCPIFLKKQMIDGIPLCDYEPEVLNIPYFYCFVFNFLEMSLVLDEFKDKDAPYGRFFSIEYSRGYNDRSKTPTEYVSSFDPSQAYNINMDWNKAFWEAMELKE